MKTHSDELTLFVAVVEAGSFRQAAENLGMDNSVVSRGIKRLEEKLATVLLNRTTRRVSLTEEGSWFYQRAVKILTEMSEAEGLLLMRHDIAQQIPAVRPAFEMACAKLGCAMPWPRVTEQISLEASDLHPRPGHAGQYELSGTLRNRAAFAQAYPHIEITLNDNFNRALVRKVLPPDQWLPAAQRKTPAFEASSDLAFTVTFEALGQPAAGYTLYFFYP